MVASVGLMMVFAGAIGRFVSDHPSIKMLALSLGVEMLNIRFRKRSTTPVQLKKTAMPGD